MVQSAIITNLSFLPNRHLNNSFIGKPFRCAQLVHYRFVNNALLRILYDLVVHAEYTQNINKLLMNPVQQDFASYPQTSRKTRVKISMSIIFLWFILLQHPALPPALYSNALRHSSLTFHSFFITSLPVVKPSHSSLVFLHVRRKRDFYAKSK